MEVSVELDIVCSVHNLTLDATEKNQTIEIEPCSECITEAEKEGYDRCETENEL